MAEKRKKKVLFASPNDPHPERSKERKKRSELKVAKLNDKTMLSAILIEVNAIETLTDSKNKNENVFREVLKHQYNIQKIVKSLERVSSRDYDVVQSQRKQGRISYLERKREFVEGEEQLWDDFEEADKNTADWYKTSRDRVKEKVIPNHIKDAADLIDKLLEKKHSEPTTKPKSLFGWIQFNLIKPVKDMYYRWRVQKENNNLQKLGVDRPQFKHAQKKSRNKKTSNKLSESHNKFTFDKPKKPAGILKKRTSSEVVVAVSENTKSPPKHSNKRTSKKTHNPKRVM